LSARCSGRFLRPVAESTASYGHWACSASYISTVGSSRSDLLSFTPPSLARTNISRTRSYSWSYSVSYAMGCSFHIAWYKRSKFDRKRRTAISRNFYNTKSTTSMAFSPSIASPTSKHSAPAKNSKSVIARQARTRLLQPRSRAERLATESCRQLTATVSSYRRSLRQRLSRALRLT
jgi:hypothetical protein